MTTSRRTLALSLLLLTALALLANGCGSTSSAIGWSATRRGSVVEIAYGQGTSFPQYGALHLDSGYLRLNYGPGSGWGTSVIILPSFWVGGVYFQGAPVTVAWAVVGEDLVGTLNGTIGGLTVTGQVRLLPPTANSLTANVSMTASGSVTLDNRPGEAFKPVMLSSMHIDNANWDAQSAYVGAQTAPLPGSGWILQPPVNGSAFGLLGGTSTWKTNAPTVEITLPSALPVTGWVTASADPNDDNLGFWAASDTVLSSWQYQITARP